ncbi:hypothetical protein SAMN05446037_105718 [Anaerovirgula multivorans]|uniref:SurA N-terminal domain-containing protein n=1 Tax=Anaerovirgula multivorans TaxID=312168 RepID=A0A239KZ47_9FIRM|nr:hypothetical protein [Anaerovirgula multivorans]SNT22928.1 hypothetical protein SAMN05446037_105718 [Anaerovirgula multivorans]
MKKNKISILVLVSIIICLVISVGVQANNGPNTNVQEILNSIKKFRTEADFLKADDSYVLEIGERKITKAEYELMKIQLDTQDEKRVDEFLIKRVLEKKVAKDKGIEVDENEVLDYINFVREHYNKDAEIRKMADDYFEAYGFDKDSFWTSEEAYAMYHDFILLGELRGSIMSEVMAENEAELENLTYEEIQDLADEKLDKLVDNAKSKIKIKKHN